MNHIQIHATRIDDHSLSGQRSFVSRTISLGDNPDRIREKRMIELDVCEVRRHFKTF